MWKRIFSINKIFKAGLLIYTSMLFDVRTCISQALPLTKAFSHNDYQQERPLYDALENGFTHIEADIFLIHNKLIVAHFFPLFKSKKNTLENLYLNPLADIVKRNNGKIYLNYNKPIVLMIDIKTAGDKTYAALKLLLDKYSSILSYYDNGVIHNGIVTVVLSGHRPVATIQSELKRFVFIDDRLNENTGESAGLYLISSSKYSKFLSWKGTGNLSAREDEKLKKAIGKAHEQGKRVRLYASPENRKVWRYLISSGVDLINTDQLGVLKDFFISEPGTNL